MWIKSLIPLLTTVMSALIASTIADVYLHNPRGSNNRLDEKTRNRANANALFDSQNNDRGGYNVGSLFYYQGSVLPIEWTNQHSCSDQNNNCNFVIQYMCDDSIRDGRTRQTIPTNRAQCADYNCNTDRRYRMHEDYNYYLGCTLRSRNKGLFTADQKMKRNSAISTRQNPNAARRGYECPEERDYYPYWHPTPWKDIAILTNDVSRCSYYQKESENVKGRWACVFPPAVMEKAKGKTVLPNNKEDCKKYELPKSVSLDGTGTTSRKPEWRQSPSHGLPAPICREPEWTRDNHLGNTLGGHPPMFNWTIPKYLQQDNCALRIRYNISSSDYSWNTDSSANAISSRTKDGSMVKMAKRFDFESEDKAKERGYVFKDNPEVQLFEGVDMKLRLAVNTEQIGRVFQDRSHTFAVRPVPGDVELSPGAIIHNLNVRGKRGNIVQVYPAVEYDYVSNDLEVATGDYVHIQWTGSNTNPGNNDGQGLAGTDRSNIVLLGAQVYPEGNGKTDYGAGKYGHYGINYPHLATNATFLGFSQADALTLAYNNPGQFRGSMEELDDAGTYFGLPLRKVTQPGTYQYMCTRNNNFSNRDQKGRVFVTTKPSASAPIGQLGGNVTLGDNLAMLSIKEGTFESLNYVRLEKWSIEEGEKAMQEASSNLNSGDDYASDFYVVSPEHLTQSGVSPITFTLDMQLSDDDDVSIYHATQDLAVWAKADAEIGGGRAKVQAQRGGVFVARSHSNVAMIVGVTVACLVVVGLIVAGTVVYFKRHPGKWQAVRTTCTKAELSMHSKV